MTTSHHLSGDSLRRVESCRMGTEMDVYQEFMPLSGPEAAPPVRRMDIDSLVLSNTDEMENGTDQQDVKSKNDILRVDAKSSR